MLSYTRTLTWKSQVWCKMLAIELDISYSFIWYTLYIYCLLYFALPFCDRHIHILDIRTWSHRNPYNWKQYRGTFGAPKTTTTNRSKMQQPFAGSTNIAVRVSTLVQAAVGCYILHLQLAPPATCASSAFLVPTSTLAHSTASPPFSSASHSQRFPCCSLDLTMSLAGPNWMETLTEETDKARFNLRHPPLYCLGSLTHQMFNRTTGKGECLVT